MTATSSKLISAYFKGTKLKMSETVERYQKTDVAPHSGSLFSQFTNFRDVLNQLTLSDHVVIHPDYDTDGITGGLVTLAALTTLIPGLNVSLYPPNSDDGYGLTEAAVNKIKMIFPDVTHIFTVDNGINTKPAVDYALDKFGIKTIVTDHHDPQIQLFPDKAIAVISPNRADIEDAYPFKGIAGAQVAWKVLTAYAYDSRPEVAHLIDRLGVIANISIVSDMMPIADENRQLLRHSVETMKRFKNLANLSLSEPLASVEYKLLMTSFDDLLSMLTNGTYDIDYKTIGWSISPKLNAVSRMMSDSSLAFEALLIIDSTPRKELFALQSQQRHEVNVATVNFKSQIKQREMSSLVLYDPNLRARLAGLIANNLQQTYGVPVVIFGANGGGSMRSPERFNTLGALLEIKGKHSEWFKTVGGHTNAAGVHIYPECIDEFRQAFDVICAEQATQSDDYAQKVFAIDLDVENLPDEYDVVDFLDFFKKLEPLPSSMPAPQFRLTFSILNAAPTLMGKGKKDLKFKWYDKDFEIVGFGMAGILENHTLANSFTVVGELGLNEWRGQSTVQIVAHRLQVNEV